MRKLRLFFCIFIFFAFVNISIAKDIPLLTPYIKTVNASGSIDILRNPALLSLQKEENNACIRLDVSIFTNSQISDENLSGHIDNIEPPDLSRSHGYFRPPYFEAILGFSRNINDFFTAGIAVQQTYIAYTNRFTQNAVGNVHINEDHHTTSDDYVIDVSPGFSFKPAKYFAFGFAFAFQVNEMSSLNEIRYSGERLHSEKSSRIFSLGASMGFLFNYGIHQTGLLFSSGDYSNLRKNLRDTFQSNDLSYTEKESVSEKFDYKKNFEVSLGHKIDIGRLFSVAIETGFISGLTFMLPDKMIVNNRLDSDYFDIETTYKPNHQIPISASILFTPSNFLSFSISGMFKNSSSERESRTLNSGTYYINTGEIINSRQYSISPGMLFSFASGNNIMIAYSINYIQHDHELSINSTTMRDSTSQMNTSINDKYTLSILEHRVNVAFVSDF